MTNNDDLNINKTDMDINEVKYSDLNNTKKIKSIKDVQRAAYSQGYDVSEPRLGVGDHYNVELRHRKSGESVKPARGGTLGGAHTGRKGGVDSTLVNQVANSIKKDAISRGRVDKRPKAKEKRKQQAILNKERKTRNRDPFTRKKPTRTFESFMRECARHEFKQQ